MSQILSMRLLAVLSAALLTGCLTNAAAKQPGYLLLQQERVANFRHAPLA